MLAAAHTCMQRSCRQTCMPGMRRVSGVKSEDEAPLLQQLELQIILGCAAEQGINQSARGVHKLQADAILMHTIEPELNAQDMIRFVQQIAPSSSGECYHTL